MKTEYKYSCPKCNIYDNMKLLIALKGEYKNQYFYTCVDKNCKFYLNTYLNTNHKYDNYQAGAHWKQWDCGSYSGDTKISCDDCISILKINMLDILSEFVECTWGAHYTTVFDYILKPHLDNLVILKFFLRSTNSIKDEYNNPHGYKMFGELRYKLLEIDNIEIKEFVYSEF